MRDDPLDLTPMNCVMHRREPKPAEGVERAKPRMRMAGGTLQVFDTREAIDAALRRLRKPRNGLEALLAIRLDRGGGDAMGVQTLGGEVLDDVDDRGVHDHQVIE